MADLVQLDLIEFPGPLHETTLIADDSPNQAWYQVSVRNLPGAGFLVMKASGCRGRREHREIWWRPDYAAAVEKFYQLIKIKTRRKRGRQYRQEVLSYGTE